MSTVDGTTLLSGASIAGDDYRYNSDRDDSPRKPVQTIAKGKLKSQPGGIFMMDTDNALENRPYFVTIDKNGVLPALAKLDAKLKKVGFCFNFFFHVLITVCHLLEWSEQNSIAQGWIYTYVLHHNSDIWLPCRNQQIGQAKKSLQDKLLSLITVDFPNY